MDKLNRIYRLHHLFRSRRLPVALARIQEELGCSERTARRAIAELRDDAGAPIAYDRERNGFHYEGAGRDTFELPGVWFSADELYALLTSYHLIDSLQPGILGSYIAPIRDRLKQLLAHRHTGLPDFERRIRILQMAARPTDLDVFRMLATAVMQRRRLRLLYHGRAREEITERTVSPQRLVHYRSNWYLDAWCHLRKGFRHFSIDRLHPVEILDIPAREFGDKALDRHFASAYGIFAGQPVATAVLRFTTTAARWVADEQWHPRQQGQVLSDGGFELKVPYSQPQELIMDILKYGPEVEVLAPPDLREQVAQAHSAAAERYR